MIKWKMKNKKSFLPCLLQLRVFCLHLKTKGFLHFGFGAYSYGVADFWLAIERCFRGGSSCHYGIIPIQFAQSYPLVYRNQRIDNSWNFSTFSFLGSVLWPDYVWLKSQTLNLCVKSQCKWQKLCNRSEPVRQDWPNARIVLNYQHCSGDTSVT